MFPQHRVPVLLETNMLQAHLSCNDAASRRLTRASDFARLFGVRNRNIADQTFAGAGNGEERLGECAHPVSRLRAAVEERRLARLVGRAAHGAVAEWPLPPIEAAPRREQCAG
jgi:hypothetical protein